MNRTIKEDLPVFIFIWSLIIGYGFGNEWENWIDITTYLALTFVVLGIIAAIKEFKSRNDRLQFAERENSINYEREVEREAKLSEYKWKYNFVLKKFMVKSQRKRTNKAWKKHYKKKFQL